MVGSHGQGCQCAHDEVMDGTQWLDEFVDISTVSAMNEEIPGSCRFLIRPFSQRLLDPAVPCRLTPDDPELQEEGLVITLPFTCPVKLTGVSIIGGERGTSPACVRLYSNLVDPNSVLEITQPTQLIDPWVEDFCAAVEYPLRAARFAQVTSLTLQFPFRESTATEIFWIGLKGVASGDQRKAVVTVYESRANVADHEVKSDPFALGRNIQ